MTKVTKPSETHAAQATAAEPTAKVDGELSEAELDAVSGGPTAVEMPSNFALCDGSVRTLLPGQIITHGNGGG